MTRRAPRESKMDRTYKEQLREWVAISATTITRWGVVAHITAPPEARSPEDAAELDQAVAEISEARSTRG